LKRKNIMALLAVFSMLLYGGCAAQTWQPGDTIIPPAVENLQREDLTSSSSLNNMRNISPLAYPSANMVYTMIDIDKANAPISVFADNKYLYLLCGVGSVNNIPSNNANNAGNGAYDKIYDKAGNKSEGETDIETNVETGSGLVSGSKMTNRYGNVMHIYDVENGSLVKTISSEKIGKCSAIAVKDSNLYTFDMETGKVSLFSSGGQFLTEYSTGLSEVYASKIAITDSQYIVLQIREDGWDSSRIAVYNIDTGEVRQYDANCPDNATSGEIPEITDFCLFDEKSILVSLSGGRLSLFNIEKGTMEKSCVFPMTAGFMEYDGNVLYYTFINPLYISPGNVANFSNIKCGRQIGRMLINKGFNWPQTEQELGEWLLNSLEMPIADENGRHYGMAQNTKYLFFLDFIPGIQEGSKQNEPDFMVYRIMK